MTNVYMELRKMMMNRVFVDTGGWIACIIKKDKYHSFAKEYFIELGKNNVSLVTSNYVICETLTWLNYNKYHDSAVKQMKIWKEAEQLGHLSVYWVDRDITKEADEIFKRYFDQKLSFADCASFAICRKLSITKIFGFDKHFNTLGFLLSPYQIHENKARYSILQPDM
jgi:uncharacterized protein